MTRLTVLMEAMRTSVIQEMIQTELLNVIQNYAGNNDYFRISLWIENVP